MGFRAAAALITGAVTICAAGASVAATQAQATPQHTITTIESFVEAEYPSLSHPIADALEASAVHTRDHITFVAASWLRSHPSATGVVAVAATAQIANVELFLQTGQLGQPGGLGIQCFTGLMQESTKAKAGGDRWVEENLPTPGQCEVPGPGVLRVTIQGGR